jgi:hypothetical protein
MISSTAARRWHMAQTRPIGCATFAEMDGTLPLASCRLLLRISCSRAHREGSARRRRMNSRFLFRRRSNSPPGFSLLQPRSLGSSCVRSSSTVVSPDMACASLCIHAIAFNHVSSAHALSVLAYVARFWYSSRCFSSSTATAVLLWYVPYVLRSRPCLPTRETTIQGGPTHGQHAPAA